ncbi:MAG: hypothetical protein V4603_07540 [Pseudomonadota bacterium]
MQLEFFIACLIVSLGVVTVGMLYLRHATRKVILELCHTDAAAEFWLRSTDILAYSGALILVLMFGEFSEGGWVEAIRVTLLLTLLGMFFAVLFVAKNVWKAVAVAAPAREK